MKLFRYLTAISGLLLYSVVVSAEVYIIDIGGQHAFIQFKASHLGYSYILGRFKRFEGRFNYDESNPSETKFNITIEAASLDSDHAERDRHLRGDDYFDVDNFPEITFDSTGFEGGDEGEVTIIGDLSLRGVTKSVIINARHIGHGDDPWGGYRRGFEGSFIFDSAEFGFDWVGEVEVYLVGEGIRQ